MSNKSSKEIRATCILDDFYEDPLGRWVEVYLDTNITYTLLFGDSPYDVPMTIYKKYDNHC